MYKIAEDLGKKVEGERGGETEKPLGAWQEEYV